MSVLQKSSFLWEFQAETLYMCTKHEHANLQIEILTMNVISCIEYFRDIILESMRYLCETTLADNVHGRLKVKYARIETLLSSYLSNSS